MKRFIYFLLYSLLLLFIGRHLSFLPHVEFQKSKVDTDTFFKDITTLLGKDKPTFSVYYKNLKTGESFGIDENKNVTGASLNKLIIVAYLYNLAKYDKIDLNEKIVLQKDDIQDYGTGSLRYQEPGKLYSLRTLAQLTLEQSDNTASHLLSLKLGTDATQRYGVSLGLKSSSMEKNTTTASDMGRLLEALYTDKITTTPLKKELFDYMKDTAFEDRLPRFLPKGTVIYHKTGDAVNFIHDVGIIEGKEAPFILSILTSDVADEEKTKELIGKIAQQGFNTTQ